MLKYIIFLALFTGLLYSCPFDEAKVEVTVVAHKAVSKALEERDYEKVAKEIENQKELYMYFSKMDNRALYQELLDASRNQDNKKIDKLLDYTLVLEIKELLGEVETNFTNYQKSRLLLIKTKKHLKALTKAKEPMQYMKKILKSIGNPGMMGVGKKEADRSIFDIYRVKLLAYLNNKFLLN